MSGLIGLWNLDGRPVDPRLLRSMMGTLAHRGPDGTGQWTEGSVGLGHHMLHTTPESLNERQPLADRTGYVCLAFDGRVDNRDEIKAALETKGLFLRTNTDAELALTSYLCWGPACPIHILGDFAFVIWDGWNQRLFCARDSIGNKPLYYYMDGHVFLCASELPPILAHPAVSGEWNEGMIGEYLAGDITSQEETLYRNVFRLPPAHCLVIQPGRLRKERYWDIDPSRTISYASDRDYAEHFLALFEESLRCRLRSHRPVGAYLSGGLDSSSVVCLACSLGRQGSGADHGLETYSLVFPGLSCDEDEFIREVVRTCHCPSHSVRPVAQDETFLTRCAAQGQDFPGYPNGTMGNPLRALAQRKGTRVLLTGGGGDEWLAGSLYHAADLLRQGRIRSMLRRTGSDGGYSGLSERVRAGLLFGVSPLLPPAFPRLMKRIIRRDGIPPWMNRDFASRIALADRLAPSSDSDRSTNLAQADLHSTLTSGWWPHTSELEERAAASYHIEERHPLSDRRLVEFALALPEDQRWRGTMTKFILRQAMPGILPESIRMRRTKAEFTPVFSEAFTALGGPRFFDKLAMCSMGLVDGPSIRRMAGQLEVGTCGQASFSIPDLWPLWMMAGIEIWLKAVYLKKADRTSVPAYRPEAAWAFPPQKVQMPC